MTLPLNVFDLEVGKLYKGWWMTPRSHQPVEDCWLQQKSLATGDLGGAVASLSCFVLLEKEKEPDREEEDLMCKILTHNGEVGWVCLAKDIHWFKELTGDKS